jgi:hypothetical protein
LQKIQKFNIYRKPLTVSSLLNIKHLKTSQQSIEVNAQTIQQALSDRYADHKYIIFNTFLFDWESDYLSVNESQYIYECEIKITEADFKKDFKKLDKHTLLESKSDTQKIPNKFYYAAPRGILPSYRVPEYAGLIEISLEAGRLVAEVVKNAPFLHRDNIFEQIRPQLLDKFYHKYKRTEFENYELNKEIDRLKSELTDKK